MVETSSDLVGVSSVCLSRIHQPLLWVLGLIGFISLVLLLGTCVLRNSLPSGMPHMVTGAFGAAFALVAVFSLGYLAKRIVTNRWISHVESSSFPELPTSPLTSPNIVVNQMLIQRLERDGNGWKLAIPSGYPLRHERFAIGFMLLMAAVGSVMSAWSLHSFHKLGFSMSLMLGGILFFMTGIIGVFAGKFISGLITSELPRASRLEIPDHGAVVWTGPDSTSSANSSSDDVDSRPLSRQRLRAIQICAWKRVSQSGSSTTHAWLTQILLVFTDKDGWQRLPLVSCGDALHTVRLAEHLAKLLELPVLFHATRSDWQKEIRAARERPLLKSQRIL